MTLVLITPPAAEPLGLADAKLHLRVDGSDDDALIAAMIQTARQQAEAITGRALITQTLELRLDQWPTDHVDLPRPPLGSVSAVTYLDADGVEQTLNPTTYEVETGEDRPARLRLAYGQSWPSARCWPGAVRIRYTAGYGATADDVPAGIRSWMLLQVASLYGQRETFVIGQPVAEVPGRFVDGLLDPYRLVSFA